MNKILRLENITKTFPGVIALSNVSLEIYDGEVLGLVGENGAGKSTLMKILAGIYRQDEGKILYADREVLIRTPLQAQQLGLSIIFQEFNLVNQVSVAENIFAGRLFTKKYFGVDWKRVYLEAKKLLQSVGLDISPKTKVEILSVAQMQMVEIAKALSFDSKIIIMDEPSATLTDNEINHLFTIIKKLKEKGKTIVYISHQLQEVFDLADRIAVLRDGQLVRIARTNDFTKESIIEAMVGREMANEFPTRASEPQKIERLRIESLSSEGKFTNISFNLRKGEVLGIAGLVGAGRTEVARAIFGIDPNIHGKIFINGNEYLKPTPKKSIQNQIAFLTENRKEEGLVLQESVKKQITMANLKSVSKLGIINNNSEVQIAEQYRESLRIRTPNVEQKVVFLSGGNQQKTIIAKWLHSAADIFILDEPTRGIDVGAKYEICLLINDLVKLGKSVIMISSELPEIIAMSDRVLVMHNGKITGALEGAAINAERIMALAIS